MTLGIIHNHINFADKSQSHEGLDICISERHRANFKKTGQARLEDFTILNAENYQEQAYFPREAVAKLYDTVLFKYKEKNQKAKQGNEVLDSQPVSNEPKITEINGKILKEIIDTNGEITYRVSDENPSEELSSIINNMVNLKGRIAFEMSRQVDRCINQLKIGTLDMSPNDPNLYVFVADNKVELVTGPVPRKVLIKTLWFLTNTYFTSPSFQQYLTIEITEGKYTAGYNKGVWFFNTQGLTEIEKQVSEDLKLIKDTTDGT